MRNTGPILSMIVLVVLALFFSIDVSEAMARGGGGGGGGGGGAIGGGGGFGGARGGGIRSAPPGAYRMRRAYSPFEHGRQGSATSQPAPSTRMQPASPSPQRTDINAPQTGRYQDGSPRERQVQYRDITEKYEKLREARHREYWENRNNQP